MELNQEQIQRLQSKLRVGKCPNCGNPNPKKLDSHIYQLMSYDTAGTSLSLDGKIAYQPLISAVCPKCGYVMLFNLKDLGIL